MARRCTICQHPRRDALERELINGAATHRSLARRFEVSVSALYRHRRTHLPELIARGLASQSEGSDRDEPPAQGDSSTREKALAAARQHQAAEAQKDQQAIDIVQQLRAVNAACLEVLRQARADGKHAILLKAVDRIARQIEIQSKLLGQIQDGPTVNLAILPEWRGIRQAVLEALEPHPEARMAVVRALRGAE